MILDDQVLIFICRLLRPKFYAVVFVLAWDWFYFSQEFYSGIITK